MKRIEATKSPTSKNISENDRTNATTNSEENSLSELERNLKTMEAESVAEQRTGSSFWKRDRVSDVTTGLAQSEQEGPSSKSSSKMTKITTNEENHENKWKKFWEHHRERFKHRTEEDFGTGNRSFEELPAEVDTVFRKAIRSMRFDRSEGNRRSSNSEKNYQEKDGDKTSTLEASQQIIGAPPRRTKSNLNRLKEGIVSETSTTSQTILGKRLEIEHRDETARVNSEILIENDKKKEETVSTFPPSDTSERSFLLGVDDEEKNRAGEKFDLSTRRWSSLENLGSKMGNVEKSRSGERIEGLSIEKPARMKEKRTIGSLKSSLERKMGSVERILEDQMGKILEENLEKHPWLLPIESWIADRCKHSAYSVLQDGEKVASEEAGEKVNGRDKVEPNFDFKFTAPDKDNEDGKIECKLEHLKRPERSGFEGVNLISRLKRSEQSKSEEEGVLEMKDVKHHDLFDKLRDNVKEKMEDIHRVDFSIILWRGWGKLMAGLNNLVNRGRI